jgi:hypothetical protein
VLTAPASFASASIQVVAGFICWLVIGVRGLLVAEDSHESDRLVSVAHGPQGGPANDYEQGPRTSNEAIRLVDIAGPRSGYIGPDTRDSEHTFRVFDLLRLWLQGRDLNPRPPGYEPPSVGSEWSALFLADPFPLVVSALEKRWRSRLVRGYASPSLANR